MKVENAKEIHDELEVDLVAYCEHQLNMQHKKNCNGFNQLFKGGEAMVQPVWDTTFTRILAGPSKGVLASSSSAI